MVHEECAGDGLVGAGVEGTLERFEKFPDIFIQIPHFSGHGSDYFGLVRW
jgi:hypothetical protein